MIDKNNTNLEAAIAGFKTKILPPVLAINTTLTTEKPTWQQVSKKSNKNDEQKIST